MCSKYHLCIFLLHFQYSSSFNRYFTIHKKLFLRQKEGSIDEELCNSPEEKGRNDKLIRDEITNELVNHIIPFWKRMKDNKFGGFYGYMDYDLKTEKDAVKGVILNSRILWFFTNAYEVTKDKECLACADHAFAFLKDHCLDKKYGGVYWSLTYDGKPEDRTKHTYNQAFAIYALSSYYRVKQDKEALVIASGLFELVENTCKDEFGYLEAFDEKLQPVDNHKLSENGLLASKTMNTLLHVLEAYTEYYRATKEKKAAVALKFIMDSFADKVYNPDRKILEVFFDEKLNTISDLHSYGHDIEATWLIARGCEVLGDKEYTIKMKAVIEKITKNIYAEAYNGHSLSNECFCGIIDATRVWWVQAEAVVGFLNAYEADNSKKEYLLAAKNIWNFIKEHLIDKREGSEWYYHVDKDGSPEVGKEIAGPWKCPYHNGRMCIEVIKKNISGF